MRSYQYCYWHSAGSWRCSPRTVAVADTADMHLGTNGTWCNYPARFDIQNRDGDSWVFHGRILIKETGQYDELWLEQYDNNSPRMIRYLGGDTTETGDVQTVQTAPPTTKLPGQPTRVPSRPARRKRLRSRHDLFGALFVLARTLLRPLIQRVRRSKP